MSDWVYISTFDEIPRQGARVVATTHGELAVFRTASDAVYALADRCPHRGGPLSQGIVFGEKVACPLHNWHIDLASGEAVAPDQGCAGHYPVKVEDGAVYVRLRGARP